MGHQLGLFGKDGSGEGPIEHLQPDLDLRAGHGREAVADEMEETALHAVPDDGVGDA